MNEPAAVSCTKSKSVFPLTSLVLVGIGKHVFSIFMTVPVRPCRAVYTIFLAHWFFADVTYISIDVLVYHVTEFVFVHRHLRVCRFVTDLRILVRIIGRVAFLGFRGGPVGFQVGFAKRLSSLTKQPDTEKPLCHSPFRKHSNVFS